MKSIIVICLFQIITAGWAKKTPLYFSYIVSKTGSFISSGAIPLVEYALEEINNNSEVLQNYTLTHSDILDSGVSNIKGITYIWFYSVTELNHLMLSSHYSRTILSQNMLLCLDVDVH